MLELDARHAYDRLGAAYPARAHNALMQAEQRALLAALPDTLAGLAVFDAGCGTGRYMRIARERGASMVVGVDLSMGMLRANAEPGCVQGSITRLPLPAGWADLVVCALALGHVDTLDAALVELARVLHAGGRILCTDIHPAGAARGWRRTFRCGEETIAVKHFYRDVADWRAAAAAAGLRLERSADVFLARADIGDQRGFDSAALNLPVAILLELAHPPGALAAGNRA